MAEEQVFPIRGFKGLDQERTIHGDPSTTSSLSNVLVRRGSVFGRQGLAKWNSVSTPASPVMIGLMAYQRTNLTTTIVRHLTTAFEYWNGSAWTDITDVAPTGTTALLPQWTVMDDTLAWTNEGKDRPHLWLGTGDARVFNGTPPYCKTLAGYFGYMMLGNVSDDGTFNDVSDGHRIIRYSDDWDTTWDLCDGEEITLSETSGALKTLKVIGRYLVAFKTDGLVSIRWVGGKVRFHQEKIAFDQGILAPLSVGSAAEQGLIFLGTDLQLHVTDGQGVRTYPNNVRKLLTETMNVAKADKCVAFVDEDNDVYHLLYPRGSSNTNNGRISYHYLTGEWASADYPVSFVGAVSAKLTSASSRILLAASPTLVYQMESGVDDDGTAITRTYDTDWTELGGVGEKLLTGITATFRKRADVRIQLSVAVNDQTVFRQPKIYDIKGAPTGDTATIHYRIRPMMGRRFNIRTRFFHDVSNSGELKELLLHYTPIRGSILSVGNKADQTGKGY